MLNIIDGRRLLVIAVVVSCAAVSMMFVSGYSAKNAKAAEVSTGVPKVLKPIPEVSIPENGVPKIHIDWVTRPVEG